MQQLLATWLRLQFLQLTNEFGACDKLSEFFFTLQTGLDSIDIISNAATTQVILVVIQGCVMPRMCYVAPKALPNQTYHVYLPRTLAGRVIPSRMYSQEQFSYTTIFLCTTVLIDQQPLKVHKIEIFLASILKFALFLYYLCQNIKILTKKFFDQAIIGGDTIFPLSLRLSGIEFSLV